MARPTRGNIDLGQWGGLAGVGVRHTAGEDLGGLKRARNDFGTGAFVGRELDPLKRESRVDDAQPDVEAPADAVNGERSLFVSRRGLGPCRNRVNMFRAVCRAFGPLYKGKVI